MTDKYFISFNKLNMDEDDFEDVEIFKRLWRKLEVDIEYIKEGK